MRLYRRGPTYWVAFRLPGQRGETRQTTKHRDEREARTAAAAIVEAETRRWSRQEDLFASRDSYTWERATADWCRERVHEGISVATLEIDGQNLRYLSAAADGEGRLFFGGRMLREIDSRTVLDYIDAARALGLTVETVSKRLCTFRKVFESARARRGSDHRPLVGEVPRVPALGRSRDADGWGRALTREEWAALREALPATGEVAGGGSGRGGRGGRRNKAVDQRGWAEVCLWTAMHPADINDFTPERFNIGDAPKPCASHLLPPGAFLWRNTKNRRRTSGKVREQVRAMPPQLAEALRRMQLGRGFTPGAPVAGIWADGNRHRDLCHAAKRAGLLPVKDDRGEPHLISANDLRRTAATWLAEMLVVRGSGKDRSAVEVIAEFLGHRGLDVARRIYDRASGARLEVVASVFEAMERMPPKAAPAAAEIVPIETARKRAG